MERGSRTGRRVRENDPRKPPITVPLFADAVRDNDLVRFNYLVIESDLPLPRWELFVAERRLPFLLVGLSGVILQPLPPLGGVVWKPLLGATRFDSSVQIDELFTVLEDRLGFLVVVDDVWLPRSLLPEKVLPGDVFRVNSEVFREIYTMRDGSSSAHSWEMFTVRLRDLGGDPEFSELETIAFREWSNKQAVHARESYRRNPE